MLEASEAWALNHDRDRKLDEAVVSISILIREAVRREKDYIIIDAMDYPVGAIERLKELGYGHELLMGPDEGNNRFRVLGSCIYWWHAFGEGADDIPY